MNQCATNELINFITPYVNMNSISVCSENTDWRGKDAHSDFISVGESNSVSFEVFDNEIIIFYLGDHTHFEDYSSELQDGQVNYIERAKKFLAELFTLPVKHTSVFKGRKLAYDKYYFIRSDGTEDSIGSIWYGLTRLINPFFKKTEQSEIWKYNRQTNEFIKAK